jgi:hypothetical protein
MKDQLLTSAVELRQPSPEATRAFTLQRDQLAARGNQILASRPDLDRMVGPGNRQMAEDNNRNFSRFMESMFNHYQPEVLVETALWVFRAYRSHGFQTTYWAANLNIWMDMLQEDFSQEHFRELAPFYNWLIINIPLFTAMSEEPVSGELHGQEPTHG